MCFLDVFSKNLLERRHSHIACICLIFLHCVFSNVASNGLIEKKHSHICCICLTFLHYVFSNVLSNCLSVRMQNYTGCIDMAFLQCVFFIYVIKLLTCNHAKSHWLHFFGFSPLCLFFICLLIASPEVDEKLHW